MKKLLAPALLVLVLAVLALIIYFSLSSRQVVTVNGLIGSEKRAFFEDPDVIRILKEDHNLMVEFETVGSRRIATVGGALGTVDKYNFAFPAGVPAATQIKQNYPVQQSFRVFFTPMAVASWQPIVDVLQHSGIVDKKADHYVILDMQQLLDLMQTQTRWKDLPNNQAFNTGRQILIKSTDIRSSNSAAMYLSLASYLLNEDQVVNTAPQANAVAAKVTPLFANQGFLAGSSATPFEDYLIKGMGNSPLVMIYESQYLYQASKPSGGLNDQMVILYPQPTIFTQHTLLAMDEAGKQLGNALTQDVALQKLAIKHGYRSNNAALAADFTEHLKTHQLNNIPTQLTEVIDTPSYDMLELMITNIEQRLTQ